LKRIDLSLYAILDPSVEGEYALEDFISLILLGGVTALQVRCKHLAGLATLKFAYRVMRAAAEGVPGRGPRVPVIINDRLDIALACGADGVHLGPDDLPVDEARRVADRHRVAGRSGFAIGASARTVEAAVRAARGGADYLGVGPVAATRNKPGVQPIDLSLFGAIKQEISLPIVAIGGINEGNAGLPVKHGADGVAVISALRGTGSPREAAAALRAAVEESREG
jgi:thiamine-phosphate pyrophosphorylase